MEGPAFKVGGRIEPLHFLDREEELAADFQERWETRFSEQQRAVLKVLAEGPRSLREVAKALGVPAPNISYNLNRLAEAMVFTGEDRIYRITDRVFSAWLREL